MRPSTGLINSPTSMVDYKIQKMYDLLENVATLQTIVETLYGADPTLLNDLVANIEFLKDTTNLDAYQLVFTQLQQFPIDLLAVRDGAIVAVNDAAQAKIVEGIVNINAAVASAAAIVATSLNTLTTASAIGLVQIDTAKGIAIDAIDAVSLEVTNARDFVLDVQNSIIYLSALSPANVVIPWMLILSEINVIKARILIEGGSY
ncbi:MAG: hypothetical protein COA63_014065 [Methylophaga sp.]|nr:hypothetical protein [Methylophaga sp.]